jgi:hypothetical protein
MPDINHAFHASAELRENTKVGRAYVFLIHGREHNVFVETVGNYYFIGRVALNKVVMLINKLTVGKTIVKVVDQSDEQTAVGPGEELVHSEPCVIPSKTLVIRVKIEDVSIAEDPWRPLLGDAAFDKDGSVIPEELCNMIPAFKSYYVKGVGFAENPEVWSKPKEKTMKFPSDKKFTVTTPVVDDEEESTGEHAEK